MSICLGRVMLMDGLSYPQPYASFYSIRSYPSLIVPCPTIALEDLSNCQAFNK